MGETESISRMRRNTAERVMARLDASKLKWRSALPTLDSLDAIKPFSAPDMLLVVTELDATLTLLEKARGHGVPVLITGTTGASLEQAVETFDDTAPKPQPPSPGVPLATG